jgi:hypothetical protein
MTKPLGGLRRYVELHRLGSQSVYTGATANQYKTPLRAHPRISIAALLELEHFPSFNSDPARPPLDPFNTAAGGGKTRTQPQVQSRPAISTQTHHAASREPALSPTVQRKRDGIDAQSRRRRATVPSVPTLAIIIVVVVVVVIVAANDPDVFALPHAPRAVELDRVENLPGPPRARLLAVELRAAAVAAVALPPAAAPSRHRPAHRA